MNASVLNGLSKEVRAVVSPIHDELVSAGWAFGAVHRDNERGRELALIVKSPSGTLAYILCDEGALAGKLQNLLDDTDSKEDRRGKLRTFMHAERVDCEECARLSEWLKRAEQTHQAGRGMLAMNADNASVAEWRHLYRVSEEARLEVEFARLEFEQHKRRHRLASAVFVR